MKKLVSIFLSLLCILSVNAQYDVHHYSIEDGLSQNTVMAIIQDRDDYMWFGTWDGLNKFDGYKFTTYKSYTGQGMFRSNRIEYIREDSLGYIWFQTYDGRFHRLDKQYEKFYTLSIPLPLMRYKAESTLVEPSAGELWMASENGIVRIVEHENGDVQEQLFQTENGNIHFIINDNRGYIWYTDANILCRRAADGRDSLNIKLCSEDNTEVFVAKLYADKLWFGGNNGHIWNYSFQDNRINSLSLRIDAEITDIIQLSEHELMFSTKDHGLYIHNTISGNFEHKADGKQIGQIFSLNKDSHGIVWIANDRFGIWRYNIKDRSLKYLRQQTDKRFGPLMSNMLLLEDSEHNVWVNPFGGGFSKYNSDTDELENPLEITNMIHTAYVDNQGNLWLSTYETGIDCIRKCQQQFRLHDMRKSADDIGEVRSMLQMQSGEVLLAGKDGYISSTNGKRISSSLQKNVDIDIYCMLEDSDGSILLGTRYNGLYRMRDRRLSDIATTSNGTRLNNNAVYDLLKTQTGDLYVGTYGGGVNIISDNKVVNHNYGWSDYPITLASRVRCLLNIGDSMVLAGTTNGLLQIRQSDLKTWFTHFCDVHCLLQDHDGDIWMGTFSGGLNKITRLADDKCDAEFETYTMQNGLKSDIVLSISEDNSGRIWFSSENNITCLDKQTHSFQHFTPLLSSKTGRFTESKALKLKSGDIMFGYHNGYCVFSPEKIVRSEDSPNLQLTDFQLFNNNVHIGLEDSPLKKSISYTECITLEHYQSVWSIEYAAIDLFNADKIEYAFILDGFEKEWNKVHNQRKATYTNLPAGKYVFRVRSTNAEGVWLDNERAVTIHILPSFWNTGWAILIYILIAFIIIWIIYIIVSRYNHLQQQMQVEQQVTDFRLRFFTNISHELRTPLTLISGPVDNILNTEKLSANVKTQLEIVQSNARRMLRLINEILDFRKIQNKKMRLRISEIKLGQLVEDTCSNFNKEAFDKHIHFRLDNQAPDAMVWIDREKIDIILYNLLSNAFKFTPAGKSITVSINEKPNFVLLRVTDEGVGIPQEKRGVLFERFSSHNEIENLAGKTGTGIGLNLVKELVDLHKGYIEVDSEPDKGTTFTVMLRTGKEHFGNEVDFISNNEETLINQPDTLMQSKLDNMVIKQGLPHLLVVEDNDDMRTFMTNIFSTDFIVETAIDGLKGWKKLREKGADIVITDLMMPHMDGLELTNNIKSNSETNHIPVILLTAKEAIDSRLEAMHNGADDYITKPFSAEYLRARVNNLLEQRHRLRERYRKDLLSLQSIPLAQKKSPDEIFLAKLLDFMDKNMDNSELMVEEMVDYMAMTRTVFFNKLKSLTGLSPVEFIREVRIKHAAKLLETGNYNVTDVTYMVGMSDSRYFSKCFKTVYGMTPTEYKKYKTEEK